MKVVVLIYSTRLRRQCSTPRADVQKPRQQQHFQVILKATIEAEPEEQRADNHQNEELVVLEEIVQSRQNEQDGNGILRKFVKRQQKRIKRQKSDSSWV